MSLSKFKNFEVMWSGVRARSRAQVGKASKFGLQANSIETTEEMTYSNVDDFEAVPSLQIQQETVSDERI